MPTDKILQDINLEITTALQTRTSRFCTGNHVELIGVSKTHTVEEIQPFVEAGLTILGENLVQEAKQKAPHLPTATWHLIGHLQTNKAKDAVQIFELIHSVDSDRLLLEINKQAARINKIQKILLQVNIAAEDSKFGMSEDDLLPLAQLALTLPHIKLCGMMVIGPLTTDDTAIRKVFRSGYAHFQALTQLSPECKYLSMGMSSDYKIAIQEGSNMVRIGSKIFGQRVYK